MRVLFVRFSRRVEGISTTLVGLLTFLEKYTGRVDRVLAAYVAHPDDCSFGAHFVVLVDAAQEFVIVIFPGA